MQKKAITLILLVLTLSLSAELIDKIVAKVGTDIILLSDLQKEMAQMQSAGLWEENTKPKDVNTNTYSVDYTGPNRYARVNYLDFFYINNRKTI